MQRLATYLGSSLVICCFVWFGLFHSGDAGKTFKLPHYDVTFGTWPLMEVTKRGISHKHGGRARGPRGRHFPGVRGYRLGPPPPPGKLVMLSPTENKGKIHQHLQETIKHYAFNKQPLNFNLPIIVKAPGPNPPPPPPGYILGSPSALPPKSDGWKPGPPPLSISRPSRLMSMLQNAAFSGMFKTPDDTFISPQYSALPPSANSGTFMTIHPDGSQVVTHVNGDFVPPSPGSGPNPSGIEIKPSVPPVLKIGGNLPENYTVLYAQRQIVGVKSPDALEHSGHDSPGTAEYEVGINLGKVYEQGYGRKPPPTHPISVVKFQKRGDVEPLVVNKLVTQDLPDSGLISTTNIVFATPNISAPLGGKNSPHFKAALEDKLREQKLRKIKEKPLDAQVKLLGRLFTKLQRLKPPKIAVPEDEVGDSKHLESNAGGGTGWGWGEEPDDDGWKKKAKTRVDSPIMAVQIQTFSVPEVDSSDPDVLESMAEFGTHDVEFADTDEIVNLMETVMKHGSSRINMADLGSNPQEINDNLLNWARRHLSMSRDANAQAHANGENIANRQFKQFQTFVTPPFANNGWSPGMPEPVDPKRASRSMPVSLTNMVASMQAPQF